MTNEQLCAVQTQFMISNRILLHLNSVGKLHKKIRKCGHIKLSIYCFYYRFFGNTWEKDIFSNFKKDSLLIFIFQDMMIHMYLFYSFVYSTVEGWQESGEKDDRLKQLLSETNKLDKLRRFRNAVFHVQKEFISPKTISFLDEKDTEHWIREVHFALGKALENHPDIKPYFEMGKKLF